MKTSLEIIMTKIDSRYAYFGIDWIPEANEYRYTFMVRLFPEEIDLSMDRMMDMVKVLLRESMASQITKGPE